MSWRKILIVTPCHKERGRMDMSAAVWLETRGSNRVRMPDAGTLLLALARRLDQALRWRGLCHEDDPLCRDTAIQMLGREMNEKMMLPLEKHAYKVWGDDRWIKWASSLRAATSWQHFTLGSCQSKISFKALSIPYEWEQQVHAQARRLKWNTWRAAGKELRPSTMWFTLPPCTCRYSYGRRREERHEMPQWLQDIAQHIRKEITGCDGGAPPNSCLINKYQGASTELVPLLPWHADDERIFGDRPEVTSLSMGGIGLMEFCAKQERGSPERHIGLQLHAGTVVHMAPGVQGECLHRVTGPPGPVARISMTWRTIVNHDKGCPLWEPQDKQYPQEREAQHARVKMHGSPQPKWRVRDRAQEGYLHKQFQ